MKHFKKIHRHILNNRYFASINLLLIFILTTSSIFADGNRPNSALTNVTVYLNGAQITRTASINLPNGTTEFIFENLSPFIQESSIQISGLKNASILSINYGINYLSKHDYSDKAESLKDQIESIMDKIQFEDDLISGFNEELNVIQSNRRLGNENEVVSLEKLQQFATYYRKRITAIKSNIYKSNQTKADYNIEIADLKKQLAEINGSEKVQTGEIKVKLNSDIPTSLNLTIKYNVTNAGWFPIYDLKAEKINAPLQLAYKAHVYQTTGTNWDDIKLTLSTSDPNTNNIKPDLNPKYLNFVSRYTNYKRSRASKNYNYKYNPLVQVVSGKVLDETGLPLPGATVLVKGTSIGTSTDFDGNFSLKVAGGQELQFSYVGFASELIPIHSSVMNVSLEADNHLDEVVVVGYGIQKEKSGYNNRVQNMAKNDNWDDEPYEAPELTSNGDVVEEGIANTRFEIKKQYSIPTDGDITVIEIDKYSVPADFAYFTAPVINENVFLTAKIGNWEQYNLLPGEANVYFEGSYSGKTNINPQATTDSLTVSLGVDPNVVVKRNELNNFKKSNLIGNNKIFNKAYEIELKNNKAARLDLVLMDRIPISQNRDIKIDDIEKGSSKYDNKKGLLEWKVTLPSKETRKYKFSYTVKYPKYKQVNL